MNERAASRALLLFAAWAIAACHKTEPPAEGPAAIEVRCLAPDRVAIDETVALRGRIEPPPGGDLPVASQVPGRIVSVAVQEGQHVAQGDLVAVVDDVSSRDASLQADAAVAQAKASLGNAQVSLERIKTLVDRGIAAKQELDDASARVEEAKGALNATVAAADLARKTLGRVAVRSSFDGVVTKLWRGAGAIVDGTAATPIVQLAARANIELVADATEQELASIAEGQIAHGQLVATHGDVPFDGVVRARSSTVDSMSGLGSVRIVVAAGTTALVGAYGRVVITTGHREAVRVVPTAAIRGSISDGVEVVVCKDGVAEIRTIVVGHRDAEHTEVVSGLADDETIAVDHVLGLEDGTALQVVAASSSASARPAESASAPTSASASAAPSASPPAPPRPKASGT